MAKKNKKEKKDINKKEWITVSEIESQLPTEIKTCSILSTTNSRNKFLWWFNSLSGFILSNWFIMSIVLASAITLIVLTFVVNTTFDKTLNTIIFILLVIFAFVFLVDFILCIVALSKLNTYKKYYDKKIAKVLKTNFILTMFVPIIPQWIIISKLSQFYKNRTPNIFDIIHINQIKWLKIKDSHDEYHNFCPVSTCLRSENNPNERFWNVNNYTDDSKESVIVEKPEVNSIEENINKSSINSESNDLIVE